MYLTGTGDYSSILLQRIHQLKEAEIYRKSIKRQQGTGRPDREFKKEFHRSTELSSKIHGQSGRQRPKALFRISKET